MPKESAPALNALLNTSAPFEAGPATNVLALEPETSNPAQHPAVTRQPTRHASASARDAAPHRAGHTMHFPCHRQRGAGARGVSYRAKNALFLTQDHMRQPASRRSSRNAAVELGEHVNPAKTASVAPRAMNSGSVGGSTSFALVSVRLPVKYRCRLAVASMQAIMMACMRLA